MTWEGQFHKGWETKEEYLSGNLKQKYKIAQEANEKYQGVFENNLKAIEDFLKLEIFNENRFMCLIQGLTKER